MDTTAQPPARAEKIRLFAENKQVVNRIAKGLSPVCVMKVFKAMDNFANLSHLQRETS